jgi:hypothetical protein
MPPGLVLEDRCHWLRRGLIAADIRCLDRLRRLVVDGPEQVAEPTGGRGPRPLIKG